MNRRPNGEIEILIAEDSATQRARLQHVLESRGYVVNVAVNGRDALDAARQRKPDVIVSDIMMPELDGYGLCKAIKASDDMADVPVMLLTTLSDPGDVIHGLESGADNFIRKPYDEDYLLARIDYLLMDREMRRNQKMQLGVEITLGGQRHFITAERQQILDLLISTYEQATYINKELAKREQDLAHSNQVLNGLYRIADGLNQAATQKEAAEIVLERALELPGVQAGWITLREGESGHRVVAARNLPPALQEPSAMDGDCACRRRLVSGELDSVTNILECERLGRAAGETCGLRYHASVPLWREGRTIGLINLVGPDKGLFNEDELKLLYGIGNQVAVALERAHLHEHLERLVEERTEKLAAEIEERKRVEREQARLTAIIEATPDMVATADLNGYVQFVNEAGLRMLGWRRGEEVGRRIRDAHPEWAARRVLEEGIPYAKAHSTWSGESAFVRPEGGERPVSQVIIAHKGEDGAVEYMSTIARDITVLKEHERRIDRLNRVHAVLSGINTTIVRMPDQQELCDEACRIAVEAGEFKLAWVGLLTSDVIVPVARAGFDDGYVDLLHYATQTEAPDSLRLVTQVLKERVAVVCNDVQTDSRMGPRREEALRRGYRSVAMFPLTTGDRIIGVLALYAAEIGFFDTDEMRLLFEVAGDVSFALDNRRRQERLNYLAYYDVLTGLPNRTLFQDRLEQRMAAARRDQTACAVITLDLDRFRNVNDTLGHHAGDELLRQVARSMTQSLGETDVGARLGADTFAVMTRRGVDARLTMELVERLLSSVNGRSFEIAGQELRIAAKAGVAVYPNDGEDADTLLRNADAALDNAKQSGDRHVFYAPEVNVRVAATLTLESKLRRALERRELALHYQPKVSLAERRICGMEALMRWRDPEAGFVPASQFIFILEETGLILEAGRWALEQAVTDARGWQAKGLRVPPIAVNVSQLQMRQKDFVDTVECVLNGVASNTVDIEITESLLMQDVDANVRKLEALREMGVGIAVDDFGTGYSSLSYIARLPISALKIDRAFVINMAANPTDLSIVSTIISLGHSLDLKIIAEGVETEEQAKLLRLLKCDEFQGYLYSAAISGEQMKTLLQQEH